MCIFKLEFLYLFVIFFPGALKTLKIRKLFHFSSIPYIYTQSFTFMQISSNFFKQILWSAYSMIVFLGTHLKLVFYLACDIWYPDNLIEQCGTFYPGTERYATYLFHVIIMRTVIWEKRLQNSFPAFK